SGGAPRGPRPPPARPRRPGRGPARAGPAPRPRARSRPGGPSRRPPPRTTNARRAPRRGRTAPAAAPRRRRRGRAAAAAPTPASGRPEWRACPPVARPSRALDVGYEAVALTRHGLDPPGVARVVAEHLAQFGDTVVHGAGTDREIPPPQRFQQALAAEQFVRMGHEVLQQQRSLGRDHEFAVVEPGPPGRPVQRQPAG